MIARGLIFMVRLYQLTISPLFSNGACRFTPGCSAYAIEALARHGAIKGSYLAASRVCRCHPWGGGGLDPVP